MAAPIDVILELRGLPPGIRAADVLAGDLKLEGLDSERPTLVASGITFFGMYSQTVGSTLVVEAGAQKDDLATVTALTSRRLVFWPAKPQGGQS